MENPMWKEKVIRDTNDRMEKDANRGIAARRLLCLREAMWEVSVRMAEEDTIEVAHNTEDKVGWTMAFIRATEKGNLGSMQKCAKAYPVIKDLCNPDNPNLRTQPEFAAVRTHVLELARASISEDMAALQSPGIDTDLQHRSRQKENIFVKLKRLIPGGSEGINAMMG